MPTRYQDRARVRSCAREDNGNGRDSDRGAHGYPSRAVHRSGRSSSQPTMRKAARGRARVCAVRLCQNLYEPWRFRADKRFCSNYCAARQKSSASKTKNAERLRLRRNAVTGRRCRFCWASDKNKRFHSARTCSACDRAKQRSPCHRCGGPFYSRPENRTGMIGCIVKNRIALGLDCKEESR